MTRLEALIAALATLTGARLRVWRRQPPDDGVRLLAGRAPRRGWHPALPARAAARTLKTPEGSARFAPVPGVAGAWLEARVRGRRTIDAAAVAREVAGVFEAEEETPLVAAELSVR